MSAIRHDTTAPAESRAAEALLTAIKPFARLVARELLEELRGYDTSWVEQSASELGPKKHCAAVRRRIAERKPGARINGRRFLLSQEAMVEELGLESERRCRRPGVKKTVPSIAPGAPANDSETGDLDQTLLAKLGMR